MPGIAQKAVRPATMFYFAAETMAWEPCLTPWSPTNPPEFSKASESLSQRELPNFPFPLPTHCPGSQSMPEITTTPAKAPKHYPNIALGASPSPKPLIFIAKAMP